MALIPLRPQRADIFFFLQTNDRVRPSFKRNTFIQITALTQFLVVKLLNLRRVMRCCCKGDGNLAGNLIRVETQRAAARTKTIV